MTKIQFNKMLISDLDEVMAIEMANYPIPWSKGVIKDCINSHYQSITLKQSDNIIGYAFLMVNYDESHLLNMCIDKPYQGKGLGRKLLTYLESICHYHDSQRFILEVRESNPIAQSLYLSLGFKEIGIRKNYYQTLVGTENAIVMSKQLN